MKKCVLLSHSCWSASNLTFVDAWWTQKILTERSIKWYNKIPPYAVPKVVPHVNFCFYSVAINGLGIVLFCQSCLLKLVHPRALCWMIHAWRDLTRTWPGPRCIPWTSGVNARCFSRSFRNTAVMDVFGIRRPYLTALRWAISAHEFRSRTVS